MFGKREFLESSSSSEDITLSQSNPANPSTEVPVQAAVRFIPKPPATRPISANARILSIQRAKLLNRGIEAIRVETSPFYRSPITNYSQTIDKPESSTLNHAELEDQTKFSTFDMKTRGEHRENRKRNTQIPVFDGIEDVEEIKVQESGKIREVTPVKKFLKPDSPERIDPSIIRTESRKEEITPEPRRQRVVMAQARGQIRARPSSQISDRRLTEFKTVTTVSSKKLGSSGFISPDFKNSAFLPVPLGSSLQVVMNRVKEDGDKKSSEVLVKLLSTGLFMFGCKKRKSGNYLFSLNENDYSKKTENFLGQLSLKHQTEYRFFDSGKKYKSGTEGRRQYGSCIYENDSFFVIIPKVEDNKIVELHHKLVECNFGKPLVEKFYLKKTKQTGFLPSMKNFILTDDKGIGDYVKMEKTRKGIYKLSIFSPFSPFQAVCIALTRFSMTGKSK